ncbi:MAG: dihydroorotase [Candidatus Thermoplasmatota archaeon]|jgi:dihydroorotase|nr:dihydroorotase [Candidatus Thermoplasmatota archaeon]
MEDIAYTGNFYRNGSFEELTVYVSNGIINDVRKFRKGEKSVLLEGAVLPGFTDIHVHFRDPGETEKEDFITGSTAAAYGGTTTVFDMPNNIIPITDYERFSRKKAVIEGRSYVDYGLYSMYDGTNGNIVSGESSAIKIFMGGSTNSKGATLDYENDSFLREWPKNIVFHGELDECLKENNIEEITSLKLHDLSRPSVCEKEAMRMIMKVRNKNKIVAHLSDWNNLSEKDATTNIEMTPHHMLLNYSMNIGSLGKVNPPIRSAQIMRGNLQSFLDGKIDLLSSDHAPHREEDKEEFEFAKSGIPGVETRIPLMLALVSRKILPLSILVKTGAENPAEKFRIMKGKIEKGYYADFVCVKFSDISRINEERLHSKNPRTPFNGFEAVFPHRVIMKGEDLIDGRDIIEERRGRFMISEKGEAP